MSYERRERNLVAEEGLNGSEVTVEGSIVEGGTILEILRIHFCTVREQLRQDIKVTRKGSLCKRSTKRK